MICVMRVQGWHTMLCHFIFSMPLAVDDWPISCVIFIYHIHSHMTSNYQWGVCDGDSNIHKLSSVFCPKWITKSFIENLFLHEVPFANRANWAQSLRISWPFFVSKSMHFKRNQAIQLEWSEHDWIAFHKHFMTKFHLELVCLLVIAPFFRSLPLLNCIFTHWRQ